MGGSKRYDLQQDRKGVTWDLLLYVPTVSVLLSLSAKFWYGNDTNLAYILAFLGSFFLIAGANRIFKTRLMLLPSSPVTIEADGNKAVLTLRNGRRVELLKKIRFYSDYSGRSFGLAGMDGTGKQQQYIFHKGQFRDEQEYLSIQQVLRDG